MLARVLTRLFYAAVFFALGVWAAPSIGGLGGMIDSSLAAGSRGFDSLWSWAEGTVSVTPPPTKTAATSPTAPAPAATATPAPVKAAAVAPTLAPTDEPLTVARAANARGDVAGAIRAYDALVAERPNDVVLRGELGNVYWSAGRLQDAAKAYHGAALVLIAARRLDEAARLEGAVRKGDAGLADDIARRLAEARRPS